MKKIKTKKLVLSLVILSMVGVSVAYAITGSITKDNTWVVNSPVNSVVTDVEYVGSRIFIARGNDTRSIREYRMDNAQATGRSWGASQFYNSFEVIITNDGIDNDFIYAVDSAKLSKIRISTGVTNTTVPGTGPFRGVSVGGGYIYVTDLNQDAVKRLTTGFAGLTKLISIADPRAVLLYGGYLYVSNNMGIHKYTTAGTFVSTITNVGSVTDMEMNDGYIWAAKGTYIYKIDPTTGEYLNWSTTLVGTSYGIALDPYDRVYVGDWNWSGAKTIRFTSTP